MAIRTSWISCQAHGNSLVSPSSARRFFQPESPTDALSRMANDFTTALPWLKPFMPKPAPQPQDNRFLQPDNSPWYPNSAPGFGSTLPGDYHINVNLGNNASIFLNFGHQFGLEELRNLGGVINGQINSGVSLGLGFHY